MRTLFGTDGIRGLSNKHPMTAEIAMRVGMACGKIFKTGTHRHKVIIAKDTRLSGYMLEPALTAGFTSMGMDVILLGPLPTPAVGYLTKSMRCDLGVMISASHNLYEDNGIKLFGPNGFKLKDAVELQIEQEIANPDLSLDLVPASELGRAKRIDDAKGRYIEVAKATFRSEARTLENFKIVLDCSHGAGYLVAPLILQELGAEVIVIGNEPDGFNINRGCGSTSPEVMSEKVKRYGADIGLALDGDADRLIVCDENGKIVDGDKIIGVIAKHLHAKGKLKENGVVATVMSNMGLERWLESQGIHLIRTDVGDRYVVSHMRENGYNLGGEQSGHIIMTDITTTGDGLIAGLQILGALSDSGKKASDFFDIFTPLPQELRNLRYGLSNPLENDKFKEVLARVTIELEGKGRVLVRKSGTEPVLRIMIEAEKKHDVAKYQDLIEQAFDEMQ